VCGPGREAIDDDGDWPLASAPLPCGVVDRPRECVQSVEATAERRPVRIPGTMCRFLGTILNEQHAARPAPPATGGIDNESSPVVSFGAVRGRG